MSQFEILTKYLSEISTGVSDMRTSNPSIEFQIFLIFLLCFCISLEQDPVYRVSHILFSIRLGSNHLCFN